MTNTNGSTADGAPAKDAADAEQDVVQDAAASGQDTPIVELRDAGKSYGNIRALHGVNLTVHPGRVTCVLGDN
ncbi:sugar ABC transporter ATP-binding protein, partial [Streptomyces europaeiscabiei]|nr:sugar ABC transporter ATP-binding protein [Streptomyces europaeiscabiei]